MRCNERSSEIALLTNKQIMLKLVSQPGVRVESFEPSGHGERPVVLVDIHVVVAEVVLTFGKVKSARTRGFAKNVLHEDRAIIIQIQ